MAGNNPKVSILSPCFNHEAYIGRYLQSLAEQTFPDFEIIVVDDGSSDQSLQRLGVCADKRLRVIAHEYNKGVSGAINTALAAAAGEYVLILATDDELEPNCLALLVEYLDAHSECAFVFPDLLLIDENSAPVVDKRGGAIRNAIKTRPEALRHLFLNGNCFTAPGEMIRRAALEKAGGLAVPLLQTQDYDLHVRMLLQGYDFALLPEALVRYRIRAAGGNLSSFSAVSAKRQDLEQHLVLDNYLRIDSPELLLEIFPEDASKHGTPTKETIPFFLGLIAIESGKPVWQDWGYQTMLRFLQSPEKLELLNRHLSLSFADVIKQSGKIKDLHPYAEGSGFGKIARLRKQRKQLMILCAGLGAALAVALACLMVWH